MHILRSARAFLSAITLHNDLFTPTSAITHTFLSAITPGWLHLPQMVTPTPADRPLLAIDGNLAPHPAAPAPVGNEWRR